MLTGSHKKKRSSGTNSNSVIHFHHTCYACSFKEKVDENEKTRREELIKNIEALKAKEKELMEYINNDDNTSAEEINNLSTGIKVS